MIFRSYVRLFALADVGLEFQLTPDASRSCQR